MARRYGSLPHQLLELDPLDWGINLAVCNAGIREENRRVAEAARKSR